MLRNLALSVGLTVLTITAVCAQSSTTQTLSEKFVAVYPLTYNFIPEARKSAQEEALKDGPLTPVVQARIENYLDFTTNFAIIETVLDPDIDVAKINFCIKENLSEKDDLICNEMQKKNQKKMLARSMRAIEIMKAKNDIWNNIPNHIATKTISLSERESRYFFAYYIAKQDGLSNKPAQPNPALAYLIFRMVTDKSLQNLLDINECYTQKTLTEKCKAQVPINKNWTSKIAKDFNKYFTIKANQNAA